MHSMLSMLSAEAVVSERAHRARRRRPSASPAVATSALPLVSAMPRPRRRRGLWHLRPGSTRIG